VELLLLVGGGTAHLCGRCMYMRSTRVGGPSWARGNVEEVQEVEAGLEWS